VNEAHQSVDQAGQLHDDKKKTGRQGPVTLAAGSSLWFSLVITRPRGLQPGGPKALRTYGSLNPKPEMPTLQAMREALALLEAAEDVRILGLSVWDW
jgi:hypothetical protein